jgi:copper(I)-binding protein
MSMNNAVVKMRAVDGGLTIDPDKTVKQKPPRS